jgi:DNA-binding transcriptional MerR regulator
MSIDSAGVSNRKSDANQLQSDSGDAAGMGESNPTSHSERASWSWEKALNQQVEVETTSAPREPAEPALFRTREVVELLQLSRRQLQYWAKTGLIVPSAQTPGGHHRYSFDDLVALKATKRLIDAGVSVQKIRKSVRALQDVFPQVGRPLSELVLVATGDVVLVFQEDTVFEAITGQEWVFAVADFQREVNAYRSEHSGSDGSSVLDGAAKSNGAVPAKPGPRGTRSLESNWSQTG